MAFFVLKVKRDVLKNEKIKMKSLKVKRDVFILLFLSMWFVKGKIDVLKQLIIMNGFYDMMLCSYFNN